MRNIIIEEGISPSGYHKIRTEDRERFLLLPSEYERMNSLDNEGLKLESTSGNFYKPQWINNEISLIII